MREEKQEDQHIMKRVWNESERERDESDKWEGHWKKNKVSSTWICFSALLPPPLNFFFRLCNFT